MIVSTDLSVRKNLNRFIKIMLEEIKLKGGAIVSVDFSAKSKCRSCGQWIWWAKTKNGKNMPISNCVMTMEYESHFANCKQADRWRK